MNSRIIGIIPARMASTRFPGKPLAKIKGKPMIQRVYERVANCPLLNETVVATDSQEILNAVEAFGGKAVMTRADHVSGTDRIIEALSHYQNTDIIVNVQGDEPLISTTTIENVIRLFENPDCMIATSAIAFSKEEDYLNPNMVKVVTSNTGKALYFSRSPIPYYRGGIDFNRNTGVDKAFKHQGLYAYRSEALKKIKSLPVCALEEAESLEQLRFLYHDIPVYVHITTHESIGVDTPEDIQIVEQLL